jgi:pyruvate,water dikinase
MDDGSMDDYIVDFRTVGKDDIDKVGGKNASLGEMTAHLADLGVSVPGGFATTAAAYREFLNHDGLDQRIAAAMADLDVDDIDALTRIGREIRGWIVATPLPEPLRQALESHYRELTDGAGAEASVAVRSSATAEDLPEASFAGQQETFLNVRGFDNVLLAVKDVFA